MSYRLCFAPPRALHFCAHLLLVWMYAPKRQKAGRSGTGCGYAAVAYGVVKLVPAAKTTVSPGSYARPCRGRTRHILGDVNVEVGEQLRRLVPQVGAREGMLPARDDGAERRARRAEREERSREHGERRVLQDFRVGRASGLAREQCLRRRRSEE